jgi:hypothetical protein
MELTVSTTFYLGQLVYARANHEWAGIITGILLRPGSDGQYHIVYYVTWSDHEECQHYETELLDEKPAFST